MQFVLDYFQLGDKNWIKKYSGNIPDGMTENIFSIEIKKNNLESFIDTEKWKDKQLLLPCYLVPSKNNNFDVYVLEDHGHTLEGQNLSLGEAITLKCNVLLAILQMGYILQEGFKNPNE
jgi:hypothetical protein